MDQCYTCVPGADGCSPVKVRVPGLLHPQRHASSICMRGRQTGIGMLP